MKLMLSNIVYSILNGGRKVEQLSDCTLVHI